jgi:uncharacterized protein YndB with AHSA1/START domain
MTIEITKHIETAPERVFRALTKPTTSDAGSRRARNRIRGQAASTCSASKSRTSRGNHTYAGRYEEVTPTSVPSTTWSVI